MHYRAVGNRCAVHFQSLALDLPDNYTEDIFLEILGYLGFCSIKVDVVFIARALLGVPSYRLGASLSEAPQFFDCSSFTKYLYAQKGIWIPRLSVQQRIQGMVVDTPVPGDLVFTTSFQNNYENDPLENVGHVGLATENGTVIHVTYRDNTVVESSYEDFFGEENRGFRRMITPGTVTLEHPTYLIETSDDFRWLILKNLFT